MDLTLCRTCVTSLENKDCCEITAILEGKSIIQLIKEVAQVTVEYEDALPKHICIPCTEKLYNLYEFREQIRQTDRYLRDSSLTVIKLENEGDDPSESMICFAGEDFDIEKVNLIVSEENVITNNNPIETEELPKKKPVKYKCKDCNEICKSSHSYRIHRAMHTGKSSFPCQICSKEFRARSLLENHVRIHTGEKPFSCEECGKLFRNKINLSDHKKKMHSLDKPHVCETCGKAFAIAYDLKKHIKRHGTERPFMCEICSKLFLDSQDLYHHKKCHNAKIVACDQCGKEVQERNMHIHMQSHGVQKFQCDICDKNFTLKQTLKQHIQSQHEGKKAYQCKECGKSFSQSSNLSRHTKTHFGVRFKCMQCNKTFAYKTHANKHKRKAHPAQAEQEIVVEVGNQKSS